MKKLLRFHQTKKTTGERRKAARVKKQKIAKYRNISLTVVAGSYFLYQIYLLVRVFWVK